MLSRFLLPLALLAGLAGCNDDDDNGGNTTPPATTEDGLQELEQALSEGDSTLLLDAQDTFLQVLLRDPDDDMARTMVAALGLVNFVNQNQRLQTFVQRFGFTGTLDVFGMLDLVPPATLPSDSPTLDELQSWVDTDVLPALRIAIGLLDDVSPGFSETLVLEFDESTTDDDVEVVIDYALVRAATGGLRLALAALELTQVLDLEADIDRIVLFRFGALQDVPYRIFSGPIPTAPGTDAFCPTELGVQRLGFLNDPLATGPMFLLPAPDADAHLNAAQVAAADALRNLVEGLDALILQFDPLDCVGVLDGVEDPDDVLDLDLEVLACAAAELVPLYQGALRGWVLDLADAIEGIDADVDQAVFDDGDDTLTLPGFTLDALTLFSSATYDQRFFLPDYGLAGDPCVANAAAFPNPTLFGLLPGVTGEDWVEVWNVANQLVDVLLVGAPLNLAY